MCAIRFVAATVFASAAVVFVANGARASGDDLRLAKERRHEIRQSQIRAQSLGSVDPGIVGGTQAVAGAWPFQIALLYKPWGGSNYNMEYCGGSLVDNLHVVTAAHCVFGHTASQFWVLTNTQSLATGGIRHAIASITIHPNYNDNTTDYDIAVIKLQLPANVKFYATLLTSAQETTYAAAGTPAYVTGWGSTIATGGGYPTELRQVKVPLVSRTICTNSYPGEITARMVCAGYAQGGKDSCDGDSGGPLVVKDGLGRWRLQAGVVSWGDGCAQPHLYGVYSRMALLNGWAKNIIASSIPSMARGRNPNPIEILSASGR